MLIVPLAAELSAPPELCGALGAALPAHPLNAAKASVAVAATTADLP
jgi:hypothetical protein